MGFNTGASSEEYKYIMIGIASVCLLGLLGSFPLAELIISIFFILVILIVLSLWVRSIIRNRRLDNEAMYGPVDPNEDYNTVLTPEWKAIRHD